MSHEKLMPEPGQTYRLITRSDFDGLVCAVLLKKLGVIDEILFAHPKDMQDELIAVTDNDITTNLPYVPGVYMAFDHHASEMDRLDTKHDNHIIDPDAPSAARVVYDYFGGADAFNGLPKGIMDAVDKADSAAFTRDDIMDPSGWELLSFIMDSRTGLGRFQDFNISNYQLMMKLIDHCIDHDDVESLLALPDVKERTELYFDHAIKFKEQIERNAQVHNNLVVLDLRKEDTIFAGNRFMIYALFPTCNISMHIMWGKNKQNTAMAIGKSILNKTSNTHVGQLCLEYGGGGHQAAGSCQVSNMKADDIANEIITKITRAG